MSIIFSENIADDYLQNLLTGNRANCSAIAKQYLAQNPSIQDLYEEVFKVALYEVGHLWETNKITVATEHMATAITEGILNELYESLIPQKIYNKKVVVACVENEQHQVGIKMVADIFEMKGWESFFLGTGIPITELIKFIELGTLKIP
jgi:MerR family transcriptional regulator, light-induced transcriptional regulator